MIYIIEEEGTTLYYMLCNDGLLHFLADQIVV